MPSTIAGGQGAVPATVAALLRSARKAPPSPRSAIDLPVARGLTETNNMRRPNTHNGELIADLGVSPGMLRREKAMWLAGMDWIGAIYLLFGWLSRRKAPPRFAVYQHGLRTPGGFYPWDAINSAEIYDEGRQLSLLGNKNGRGPTRTADIALPPAATERLDTLLGEALAGRYHRRP